jgi:hypothetical protein
MLLAAVLLLSGCGDTAATSPSAVASLSPSPDATLRDLAPGEQVSLRCGLSLTVPADYDGWLATASEDLPSYDAIGSHRGAQAGLLQSFAAESVTPAGEEGLTARLGWPLLASSADSTVQVRSMSAHLGTADAVTYIAVVVRLPERPTGLVELALFGSEATDSPAEVLAHLDSAWQAFAVRGVTLPELP